MHLEFYQVESMLWTLLMSSWAFSFSLSDPYRFCFTFCLMSVFIAFLSECLNFVHLWTFSIGYWLWRSSRPNLSGFLLALMFHDWCLRLSAVPGQFKHVYCFHWWQRSLLCSAPLMLYLVPSIWVFLMWIGTLLRDVCVLWCSYNSVVLWIQWCLEALQLCQHWPSMGLKSAIPLKFDQQIVKASTNHPVCMSILAPFCVSSFILVRFMVDPECKVGIHPWKWC